MSNEYFIAYCFIFQQIVHWNRNKNNTRITYLSSCRFSAVNKTGHSNSIAVSILITKLQDISIIICKNIVWLNFEERQTSNLEIVNLVKCSFIFYVINTKS